MDTEQTKQKKCPRCGAMIPGFAITCPDCGFSFDSETDTSKSSRTALAELQDKLLKARSEKEKALLINAFAMPNTKDALLQLLILSYSNFSASKGAESVIIRRAWLSKALQSYKLLKAQVGEDADIKKQLEEYKLLEDKKAVDKLSGLYKKKIITYSFLAIGFVVAMVILLIYLLKNPVQRYVDRQDARKATVALSKMETIEEIQQNVMRLLEIDTVISVSTFDYLENGGREKKTYHKNGQVDIELQDKNFRSFSVMKYDKTGACIEEWNDALGILSHLSHYEIGTVDILYSNYLNSRNARINDVKYNDDSLITSITLSYSKKTTTYTIEYNEDNLPIVQSVQTDRYNDVYEMNYNSQGHISGCSVGSDTYWMYRYINNKLDGWSMHYINTTIRKEKYIYEDDITTIEFYDLNSEYYGSATSNITDKSYDKTTTIRVIKDDKSIVDIKCSKND